LGLPSPALPKDIAERSTRTPVAGLAGHGGLPRFSE
jgi:hypothetical protein